MVPSRPAVPAAAQPDCRVMVMLRDGPFDGQDIRATGAELEQGLLVRNNHTYVRDGSTMARAISSASLPLFRWLQEARVVLLPFLTLSYGL
ncbi:hypothetical protein [Pseudoxanthomonas gei]|nr:hypothetical protein [Pseudoxanthomonas gei]